MDDRDLLAARYANTATLADTVLLLLSQFREGSLRLTDAYRRSLNSLDDLLLGSANGASSIVKRSDLSPTAGRSLSDDLARYDMVQKVKRDVAPEALRQWMVTAAAIVERLADGTLTESDRVWIDAELEPFLDALAQLDGLGEYEAELEAPTDSSLV